MVHSCPVATAGSLARPARSVSGPLHERNLNGPQISNDSSANPGINFFVQSAAPTYGYRFFANGSGTLNQLLMINQNSVAANVPMSTTGSFSANGSIFGNNFSFSGSSNNELNSDGVTVYLHSVGNAISFVNGPNSAYAPLLGGTYTNASDRRLKRDITPYTHGLDTIMGLKPVHFVLRSDNKKSMGFIAQDVQKVLPEIVTSGKLKGKVILGVNYSAIIAPLTAAVQEQQREIVELRAEIKALKQSRE